MNFQQIESFIQVADNLSFSKAAEQMYLSIPTISRNIRLLEEEIGVTLFVRDRHKVILTPAGQSFYVDALILVETEKQARMHVLEADKKAQIRIGCTSQEEQNIISKSLSDYKKIRPDVIPRIICDNYAKQVTLLKQQGLDLLIGSENIAKGDQEINFQEFCVLSSTALIPDNDSLSDYEEISFQDLKNGVIVTIPQRMVPFKSRNIIKDFLAVHHEHSLDIECEDEQSCISLVSAGYGISVLPDYKIPSNIVGCKRVHIKEAQPYGYGVLTRNTLNKPLVDDFIMIIKKHMQASVCLV